MPGASGQVDLAVVSLVVAIAGFVVNLGFNVANFHRASKFRTASIRLDEFKRIRGSLDSALLDLSEAARGLMSLDAGTFTAPALTRALEDNQRSIVESYQKLQSVLAKFDKSEFTHGDDWVSIPDEAWDQFGNGMNAAFNGKAQSSTRKAAAASAAQKIMQIVEEVNGRLDAELTRHSR